MAIDFSALNSKPATPPQLTDVPTGRPVLLRVVDIEQDPNQPRTQFLQAEIDEMTESIKVRGVKQPISVKTHPTKPGKWMINDGAVRYRGTIQANKTEIPAFVDEDFDGFDQVVANENRYALQPMELAKFVKAKLDEGMNKGQIAHRLTKSGSVITELLALIDAPFCIEEAYRSGRCMSPKTLYELRSLHNKFPLEVQAWCARATEITRREVSALGETLKSRKAKTPATALEGETESEPNRNPDEKAESGANFTNREIAKDSQVHGRNEANVSDKQASHKKHILGRAADAATSSTTAKDSRQTECKGSDFIAASEISTSLDGQARSDPDRLVRPLLMIEFKGKSAVVLLNRKPSSPGLIRIRFQDESDDLEVEAALCRINLLIDEDASSLNRPRRVIE